MSMWVCRAGTNAKYFEFFREYKRIFLAWEGFDVNFISFDSKDEIRKFVSSEKNNENRTSVSNWMGQIISFSQEMQIYEYVLIPSFGSRSYSLAKITGEYEYNNYGNMSLHHSRIIKFIKHEIPRDIFDQDIIYSLGAYRTLFKVKDEKRVLITIKKYTQSQERGGL